MKKLLLVDGSSLLHRAFYALPLLTNSAGQYTNGLHGFMMMFNKMCEKQRPDYVVVCFDKSRVTFRNAIAADYKGTRKETPAELRGQFELTKEALNASGVTAIELEGYEADDLLGTLARAAARDGLAVEIFSGDRDVLQLISDNVTVYLTKRGISDIECWDEPRVREAFGMSPAALIDLKALMGDSSDNISGIPGVGEKTALKLMQQFTGLDDLYARIDEIENVKLRQKLLENLELAYTCRKLAAIECAAPLAIAWEHYLLPKAPPRELRELYQKLELRQLLKALPPEPAPPGAEQTDIFADIAAPTVGLATVMPLIKEQQRCSIVLLPQGEGLAVAAGEQEALWRAAEPLPEPLAALLQDGTIAKQTAQAKEIALLLAKQGCELRGLADDTMIAAYLLDPAAGEYPLPAQAQGLPDIIAGQRAKLASNGLLQLYEEVELPLTLVLAAMEREGIRVEAEMLSQMSAMLEESALAYQERIYQLAGQEFNLNSPKQLGQVLFEQMGLPPLKKTKTGYSTDAEVLEQLASQFEIARLILDFRSCFKLKSTYTDGLRPLIDAGGKIHTSLKQTVTATGRLSSAEPNLQNIPVRQELGRRIRAVFTADGPDDILLAADYNQIELRVLAHISGDEGLASAFRNGEDIHTRTAAEVLNIPLDQVDANSRRQAKAVNFGIVYGISDYGLSRDLGISRAAARDYIDRYFARYPGVAAYQRQVVEEGKRLGYVTTLLGRRRWLPELTSGNFNIRGFAQRMAINTPIQGSAADIIKLAMLRVAEALKERGLRSAMILQVHDELIFNMVPQEREILPPLVKKLMEAALPLSVPITVDLKTGRNWYDMEKM